MPAIGMGTVVGDTLKPYYEIHAIINAAATIVVLSALVSFVPARKIAKQNIVNSLKGKL
jgi:ABC-type lipoprotein release transport system permease subunit